MISIEVTDDNLLRLRAAGEIHGRLKGSVPVGEENGDIRGAPICNGKIQMSIIVKDAGSDRSGAVANGIAHRESKTSESNCSGAM